MAAVIARTSRTPIPLRIRRPHKSSYMKRSFLTCAAEGGIPAGVGVQLKCRGAAVCVSEECRDDCGDELWRVNWRRDHHSTLIYTYVAPVSVHLRRVVINQLVSVAARPVYVLHFELTTRLVTRKWTATEEETRLVSKRVSTWKKKLVISWEAIPVITANTLKLGDRSDWKWTISLFHFNEIKITDNWFLNEHIPGSNWLS